LHPTAQRKLKNVLLELSSGDDQVFINTHSSVLVVDEHDLQIIFKVEKAERETEVLPIDEFEKPYIVYELLGGSPSDLLLPKNFLIVEGKTEFELLTRIINRHYPEMSQIQIIQASGNISQTERSINAIEQVFKPLEKSIYKERVVILSDKPKSQTAFNTFLQNHPTLRINNQVYTLPNEAIEEYYPDQNGWRKTSSQVRSMASYKKVRLGKNVGNNIDKNIFENDMAVVYEAIKKCWELAFG